MSALPENLLTDLPDTIAEAISTVLPGLATCMTRAGAMNVEEVKELGAKAPAVIVAMLRGRPGEIFSGPVPTVDLEMAAYVLTKDRLGLPRDVAAGNICLALLGEIYGRDWGIDSAGPAKQVGLQSLITRASRDIGVSLWAVTWLQPVVTRGWEEGAVLPLSLYLGQAPEVGAAYEDVYREIGDGS